MSTHWSAVRRCTELIQTRPDQSAPPLQLQHETLLLVHLERRLTLLLLSHLFSLFICVQSLVPSCKPVGIKVTVCYDAWFLLIRVSSCVQIKTFRPMFSSALFCFLGDISRDVVHPWESPLLILLWGFGQRNTSPIKQIQVERRLALTEKKRNPWVFQSSTESMGVFITWTMEAAMTKADVASYHEMQGFLFFVLIF